MQRRANIPAAIVAAALLTLGGSVAAQSESTDGSASEGRPTATTGDEPAATASGNEAEETAGETEGEVPEAEAIMDKLDTLYRADSSHAVMEMVVKKPRGTRKLKLEAWSKGEDKMLVVIREPAREAGTATLRTDEGLWNYAPRADRLIRIPSGLLSDSWMGSHFTNDDLMRETSYDEDYRGTVERATLDGRPTWKLILTPKPDAPVVYSKLTFQVTRDGWLPLKTDYYDDGEIVRTMTFSNVEQIGGRRLPTQMTLRPADAEGEMTRMRYETLELGVDVSNRLFSRRGLRRRAK
ncbi:MAG: outer membrane lipoprotein-sorting protein [Bradymonadaceae bacterium]